MWTIGLCFVALLVIYCTHLIKKWKNPSCNGVLPPGSMGLPLIGETLHLIIPSYSLDLHPFIKKRIQRFGPIFRTNILGRPVVVSTDPELNHLILQQEGRLVEMWYLDTFSKLFNQEGEFRTSAVGVIHKYIRSLSLTHFGVESLKEGLLPEIEDMVKKTLKMWTTQESIEVKYGSAVMVFNYIAKHMFGYDDSENTSEDKISEKFTKISEFLMSIPLNIPGTTYHKCLKDREKATKFLKDKLEERRNSPDMYRGDLLDQVIADLNKEDKEKFLSDDFIITVIFGLLFAGFESVSKILTLTLKLLADHPLVLQELIAEHEGILKKRQNSDSLLTWDEYKSMIFTLQVINESLRLGNGAPGLLRRALKDIDFKGFTIPSGWIIMAVTSASHLNPDVYKDPLTFNPARWKDIDPYLASKNFMPFSGGTRQCAGAEFSKLLIATFLHILLTKYEWTRIKEGRLVRGPMLGFRDGFHVKFSPNHN